MVTFQGVQCMTPRLAISAHVQVAEIERFRRLLDAGNARP